MGEQQVGAVEAAVAALRAGAIDFVLKPDGGERLYASIKNALRLAALEAEIGRLGRQALGGLSLSETWAASAFSPSATKAAIYRSDSAKNGSMKKDGKSAAYSIWET